MPTRFQSGVAGHKALSHTKWRASSFVVAGQSATIFWTALHFTPRILPALV
jgi:hypothetical protein